MPWFAAGNGCGGSFTADQGVLISPNFPNPYPHDSQCVYTVTVHPNEVMNLTFTDLDLETHTDGTCEWDYVEVSYLYLFAAMSSGLVLLDGSRWVHQWLQVKFHQTGTCQGEQIVSNSFATLCEMPLQG